MIDTVLTCGTFDLFHQGHLNMLLRCKKLGKKLIVGVSSDFFNISKKNRLPVSPLHARYKLISELKCVDQVFIEDDISLEAKARYMQYYAATIFVMGDDWFGKFDDLPYVYERIFPNSKKNISVIYLPRTPSISTTEIINKFHKKNNKEYKHLDYKKSMLPYPSSSLLNTPKLPYKVIFNCRNRGHQAVHLLPYYYLFEKHNVFWYIENVSDDYGLNKVLYSMSNYIGFEIDKKQVITKLQDVVGLSINIAIFTELWKPIVLSYKAIGIKVYFIDHGICVGTRQNSWFANVWQNDVDKIIVSGQMQYDHHKYCATLPECHSQPEENIFRLFGCPKFSLYSPCEWIWNMNNVNGKSDRKRVLIAPTSFYDNYNFIYTNIVSICQNNVVVIRPHPDTMEMANPFGELFKIFIKCLDEGCAENLIIIPPNNNFLTMNLFTCDIAIFDQSSVAYEYLLVDKPGLISSLKLENNSHTKDIRDALAQIDHSTNYDISKIDFILRDPLHLREKRKRMRDYVFGNSSWIDNFINLVNHDMKGIDLNNIEHIELPADINYDVDASFYNRSKVYGDHDLSLQNKSIECEIDEKNVNISININMDNKNNLLLSSLINLINQINDSKQNTNLNPIETNLNPIETNLNPIETNLNLIETSITPIETNLNPIETNLNLIETSITPIETNLNPIETSIHSLETSIHSLETSITPIETSIHSLETSITPIETSIHSLETSITPIETNLNPIETSIHSLETSITPIETSITPTETSIHSLETSITPIETNLDSLETSITPIETNLYSLETSITSLETNLDSLETSITPLEIDVLDTAIIDNPIIMDMGDGRR